MLADAPDGVAHYNNIRTKRGSHLDPLRPTGRSANKQGGLTKPYRRGTVRLMGSRQPESGKPIRRICDNLSQVASIP
jgi:hypothetical protein